MNGIHIPAPVALALVGFAGIGILLGPFAGRRSLRWHVGLVPVALVLVILYLGKDDFSARTSSIILLGLATCLLIARLTSVFKATKELKG